MRKTACHLLRDPEHMPQRVHPQTLASVAPAIQLPDSMPTSTAPHHRHQLRSKSYTWVDWLAMVLPCVHWMREYKIKTMLLVGCLGGLAAV